MNPAILLWAVLLSVIWASTGQGQNLADTNAPNERLAPLVALTFAAGTNRPISGATTKALGLGDEPLPATQFAVVPSGAARFSALAVSARNTNDVILAHIDKVTRAGTIWLTSRMGEIRRTILVSTNRPPQVVPNAQCAIEFENRIKFFLELEAARPWDDSPHPLNEAAKFGSVADVAKALKRDPKSINAQDDEGMTPLAGAVVQEQVEVVRFLLGQGADPNIPNKDDNGNTPLHAAVGRGNNQVTEVLLTHGADPNLKNKRAETALNVATQANQPAIVELLHRHGAKE